MQHSVNPARRATQQRGRASNTPPPLIAVAVISLAVFFAPRRAAALAQAEASGSSTGGAIIVIRAGRMFDSFRGVMLRSQIIVIRGERISEVGPAASVRAPGGARVIDLSDATVLPGLIDGHEHLFLTGEAGGRYDEQLLKESWQYRTIEAVVNARRDLEAGFTTERDCGTEGAMYSDVDVKHAIDRGLVPGPRLFVSTRDLSTTGSYPLLGYSPEIPVPIGLQEVDGPWEARKAVREEISNGADFIKIYGTGASHFAPDGRLVTLPTFTLEEVKAIVDEAHSLGRKVGCHAYGGEGLENCINGGVDSIEHGLELSDDDVRKMAAHGTWLVPTLYVYETIREDDLQASGGKNSRAALHEVSFKKALAAGVKIAFGTDAGPFPHGTQAKEFEYMVAFGMKPAAAIQAATIRAAELIGWQDRVGSITPGKYADIDAVSGDPLSDITQLEDVRFVMKGGEVLKNEFPGNR